MPQTQKPPDVMFDTPTTQLNKPPDVMFDAPDEAPMGDTYTGPDSFMEGVLASGPEVLDAMGSGAMGYLKGATLDLPQGLWSGLKTAGNALAMSAGPLGEMVTGVPTMDRIKAIPGAVTGAARNIMDTFANAGSAPEQFGRMMGNMTGQGAVTAGVVKGVPPAIQAAGTPVAAAGRVMKNYQPLSGALPGMFEPRLARIAESMAGRGIEKLGNRMKGVPEPIQGEVMPPPTPDILEGDFSPVPPVDASMSTGLPPGRRTFYGEAAQPVPEAPPMQPMQPALPAAPEQLALPPSRTHMMGPSSIADGRQFEHVGPSPASITAPQQGPKIRVNSEGNFVDMGNGQTFDQTGKVLSAPASLSEILQKPFHEMTFDELTLLSKQNLDKNVAGVIKKELAKRGKVPERNSPFFMKNRKY